MFNGHITLDLSQNQNIKNIFLLYSGVSEQYYDQESAKDQSLGTKSKYCS